MTKRRDEIVESIIRAAKAAYGDDKSKYTRASLKAAKPGHGTDMYRDALNQLRLERSIKSTPVDDASTALDKITEIALSLKSYLQQDQSKELSILKAENQTLKDEVNSLKLRISELEQQRSKDLSAPKAQIKKASGGKGKAFSSASNAS